MKKILIAIFLTVSLTANATTYYLAPKGSDVSGNGSISAPWFTINKAWSVVKAGDIIYLRGGEYIYTSQQTLSNKSGSAGNLIKIWAYPGEIPVLKHTTSSGWFILMEHTNYTHIKGLEISGENHLGSGLNWEMYNCNNNILEGLNYHHMIQGLFIRNQSDGNLVLNCDFHDDQDPHSNPAYEHADGFGFNWSDAAGLTNTVRGCRFYWNSDDGMDMWANDNKIIIDNCWSFYNGYIPGTFTAVGTGGAGFKFGKTDDDHGSTVLITVKNCISYKNKGWGFNQNGANARIAFYNNAAYQNVGQAFWLNDYPAKAHILTNNIAYANGSIGYISSASVSTTSTFLVNGTNNSSYSVSDADFQSLDGSQLLAPRKADGSLPDITFLKLSSSSDLIEKGTDVGIAFSGTRPDLGPFESNMSQQTALPVYNSSVVENATPSIIKMTYSLSLANVVPAVSAFNVQVNSVARTISSVAIVGGKVQLTLASAIVYGDVVTVAYTAPANNPLQTTSGGLAASISTKSVTNNCQIPSKSNIPPFIVTKNEAEGYSGFVYEIDASGSYDLDKNILTYEWSLPSNVSASSTSGSIIQFLAPVISTSRYFEFLLKVNDGKTVVSKIILINIIPYKPELYKAKISKIEASDFQAPDYANNIIDGITTTKWSANGDNQWIEATLAKSFKISHLEIAFLPGQKYESYFDVYTSTDNLKWDLILTNASSCSFSGDNQVFDFPASDINTEYSYIKLVGHGNSLNRWNNYSEIKIIGTFAQNSAANGPDNRKIILYPNPVQNFFSISVDESAIEPDTFRITDLSGRIFFEGSFYSGIKDVQIPSNLVSGVYLVELMSGVTRLDTQKMIIAR